MSEETQTYGASAIATKNLNLEQTVLRIMKICNIESSQEPMIAFLIGAFSSNATKKYWEENINQEKKKEAIAFRKYAGSRQDYSTEDLYDQFKKQ